MHIRGIRDVVRKDYVMEELKRCTYTMRPDHIELLNEISERYALRSRSAALSFLIEEYKRHEKIQAVKDTYHRIGGVRYGSLL
jgi:hypothetical protein